MLLPDCGSLNSYSTTYEAFSRVMSVHKHTQRDQWQTKSLFSYEGLSYSLEGEIFFLRR